jgi:hypothetical protein
MRTEDFYPRSTLPTTDYILLQFEKRKNQYRDDSIFAPNFNSGWAKIDKYYKLTDKTLVYLAALVLHPSRKWKYIENHWNEEWVPVGKERVKDFWEKAYKPASSTSSTSATASAAPPQAELKTTSSSSSKTNPSDTTPFP